jgi:four helix bundle protein
MSRMVIKSHRDLIVWTKAVALAAEVGRIANKLPECERYGLATQLRRAAVSVSSNIAEGAGRFERGDYRRFVSIARGSLAEVESQLEVAVVMGYLHRDEIALAEELCREIIRMLTHLWRALRLTPAAKRARDAESE